MARVSSRFTNSKGIEELGELFANVSQEMKTSSFFKNAVRDWSSDDLIPELKQNASGGILQKRSGRLSGAVFPHVKSVRKDLRIEIKALRIPYAHIHETGGTIEAQDSYLVVPAVGSPAYNMDKSGALAGMSGEAKMRKFGPTFVKPFGDKWVVFKKQSKAEKKAKEPLRAMFLLVDQVTIPATRWISRSIRNAEFKLVARLETAGKFLNAISKK